MDKFLVTLGGVLGGYALVKTPVDGTVLTSLEPVLDLVGSLSMIVFAGVFIVRGVRSLFGK
ncbi:hypothetical protein [Paenibacillus sp. FJAT-26967]|uniref:hypothetical protein n=1 Tax=Paenibacillus sp. FJAT-26967 TaxID=1729690 RepID=UPI00083946F4|nr:hypothetical protein [Paenibacillus sp. FJAT-26967]